MGAAVGKEVQIKDFRVKIKKIIAEGGFSHVFLVKDVKTQEHYAMKRMVVDEGERLDNAEKEIHIMENLPPSRYLLKLLAWSVQRTADMFEVLILLEYCSGGNVVNIMKSRWERPFTEEEMLKIFQIVCEAVAVLHNQNPPIFHRDLKLENVLFDPKFGYKLCDFGSCTTQSVAAVTTENRALIEDDIQRNTTPTYRAPEMVDLHSGFPITEKGDIWALGCLLYKMAYRKDAFDTTLQIQSGTLQFPSRSDYSSEIERLIRFMLVRDPRKRPDVFAVLEKVATVSHIPIQTRRAAVGGAATTPRSAARRSSIRASLNLSTGDAGPAGLLSQLDWSVTDTAAAASTAASPLTVAVPRTPQAAGSDLIQPPSPPSGRTSPVLPSQSSASGAWPAVAPLSGGSESSSPQPAALRSVGSVGSWPKEALAAAALKPVGVAAAAPSAPATAAPATAPVVSAAAVAPTVRAPPAAPVRASSFTRPHVPAPAPPSSAPGPPSNVGLLSMLDWYGGEGQGAVAASASAPTSAAQSPATPFAQPVRPVYAASADDADNDLHEEAPPAAGAGESLGDRARRMAADVVHRVTDALQFLMLAPVEKWIQKATAVAPGPPKWKYVRRLVVFAWDSAAASEAGVVAPAAAGMRLAQALQRLPLRENPNVACKTALLMLRLMQDGPPQAAAEIRALEPLLHELAEQYRAHPSSQYPFTSDLFDYAFAKCIFLEKHPAFEGTFSLDTYLLHGGALTGSGGVVTPDAVKQMLSLQSLAVRLHKQLVRSCGDAMVPTIAVAFIRESQNIALASTYCLAKLVSAVQRGSSLTPALSAAVRDMTEYSTALRALFSSYSDVTDVMQLYPVPTVPDVPDCASALGTDISVRPPPSSVNPQTLRKKLRRNDPDETYHEHAQGDFTPAAGEVLYAGHAAAAAFPPPAAPRSGSPDQGDVASLRSDSRGSNTDSEGPSGDPRSYRFESATADGDDELRPTRSLIDMGASDGFHASSVRHGKNSASDDLFNASAAFGASDLFGSSGAAAGAADPFAASADLFAAAAGGVDSAGFVAAPSPRGEHTTTPPAATAAAKGSFDPFGSAPFAASADMSDAPSSALFAAQPAAEFTAGFSSVFSFPTEALQPVQMQQPQQLQQPAAPAAPAAPTVAGRPSFLASSIRVAPAAGPAQRGAAVIKALEPPPPVQAPKPRGSVVAAAPKSATVDFDPFGTLSPFGSAAATPVAPAGAIAAVGGVTKVYNPLAAAKAARSNVSSSEPLADGEGDSLL